MEQGYQTKTEWIYEQLRQMIHGGELAPGSRMPLAPLAERFGTSEIPVREALRMLQQDGLIAIESHRGATVASVSWEQLYEAMLIRTNLEILAIEEAIPFHTASTTGALRSRLESMGALMRSPSPQSADAYSIANREFHRALYEPCPYPLLAQQIQELWDRVWQSRSQSLFYMARDEMERAQSDHMEMVEAVEGGDRDRARRVATAHREGNLAAWRRIIEHATGMPGSSQAG